MSDELETKIKEMIVERCFLSVKPDEIADDALLTEAVGLDSVQILEVVVGLEEQFGVKVDDDDFDIENFSTVSAIAQYVRQRQSAAEEKESASQ
jgi:acyl carrier protein